MVATFTLDWLLGDANTLYLCAPLGDETRIGIVFATLLHDLILQSFDRANRTQAIDPRLLVLLDEAANTPCRTCRNGRQRSLVPVSSLVTVWQSKAQLEQIYSRQAENVLTNHRSKLIYPSGLSDMATIEYVSALTGNEHVRSDLDEPRWGGAGERPTETESVDRRRAVPARQRAAPNAGRRRPPPSWRAATSADSRPFGYSALLPGRQAEALNARGESLRSPRQGNAAVVAEGGPPGCLALARPTIAQTISNVMRDRMDGSPGAFWRITCVSSARRVDLAGRDAFDALETVTGTG